jgi:hypothetical protein
MLRVGVLWLLSTALVFAQAPLRVMLVTGGHDHEPTFYSVFAEQKDIVTNVNPHPMSGGSLDRYDVVVLTTWCRSCRTLAKLGCRPSWSRAKDW